MSAAYPWAIRPFAMADYAKVRALWQDAGLTHRPSDTWDEVAIKCATDGELFLVAELAGEVIGVIMGAWDGRRGWLHHLAVHPSHRRQGVATSLIVAVEQALRAKGCLKVNLLVHEANRDARALYARLGYEEMRGIIAVGKEL